MAGHAQLQGRVIELDAVVGLVDLLPALAAAAGEALLDRRQVQAQALDAALESLELPRSDAETLVELQGSSYSEVSTDLRYSRLSRAMLPTEISFGQAASHSYSFVQWPKPSASIASRMARARLARSGWP